jgi:hypothetical protein
MRWRDLFNDLEAQLAEGELAELRAEVAEQTRHAAGLVRTMDRVRPAEAHDVAVSVLAAGTLRGRLLDAGIDWVLLEELVGREALIPLRAVLGITGLSARTDAPGSEGEVGRRLDLRWALRGLARSRIGIGLVLVDGSAVTGTLDRVGADHVDVAEHLPGEARRAPAVRQVRLVPISAIALVRSS